MDVPHGKRAYPAEITTTEHGFLVAFPDFPGCHAAAPGLDDALQAAGAALEEAIADWRARGQPLPAPSPRAWGQVLFTAIPDMARPAREPAHP